MTAPDPSVTIARRFCGPPRSGNGGYVCGRVAEAIAGASAVRLKAPPPLEREMKLQQEGGVVRMLDGDIVIAEGRSAELALDVPPAPTRAQAEAAVGAFIGFKQHAFPGCFVCGPERAEGDGLRLFTGLVAGREDVPHLVASPWVPDASLADASGQVATPFIWAALDCPGAFAVMPEYGETTIVLGEIAARIDHPLSVGRRCVVAGWSLGNEGRKRYAGSAIYDAAGRAVAVARSTWIEVPRAAFG